MAKLRTKCKVDAETPILEWLPDIAVIMGTISMLLPKRSEDNDNYGDDDF
jgi:hypothetical protein